MSSSLIQLLRVRTILCARLMCRTDADADWSITYEWTDPTGAVVQTTASTAALSDTFAGTGTTEGVWTCQ